MYSIADKFSIAIQCVLWASMFDDRKRKDVAKEIGISPQSFGDYVLGRRAIGDEEVRRKICDFFNVNYEKLLELGEELCIYMDPKTPDSPTPNLEQEIKNGQWDKKLYWLKTNTVVVPEELAAFTLVPKYKARLSGGHGSLIDSDQIEANYAFRTEFINTIGNKADMALFEVVGDSMEPFIWEGDVVMVDRSRNNLDEIVQGKVYAFREDSRVMVKRLVWRGKKLIAISENKAVYDPYSIDLWEDFSLIGKVIWVGREVT